MNWSVWSTFKRCKTGMGFCPALNFVTFYYKNLKIFEIDIVSLFYLNFQRCNYMWDLWLEIRGFQISVDITTSLLHFLQYGKYIIHGVVHVWYHLILNFFFVQNIYGQQHFCMSHMSSYNHCNQDLNLLFLLVL